MKDYVSVIIPTFNRGHLIIAAIESVINQTYSNFEIIVVDDASTDDTEDKILSIEDPRIRYIRLKENVGPACARNIGIQNSRYDYIAFEDSDDIWLPKKLELQMKLFTYGYDAVYCAYQYQYRKQSIRVPNGKYDLKKLSGYIFDTLWESNQIGTPTLIVKKSCLIDVGLFSEKIRSLEDWELVLRISKKYKIGYLNEVLVDVKYSETGVNHQYENSIESLFYIIDEFEEKNLNYTNILKLFFEHLSHIPLNMIKDCWKKKLISQCNISEDAYDVLMHFNRINQTRKLYDEILRVMCNDETLNKFVVCNSERQMKIAVYGMGYLGRFFLMRLLELGIRVDKIIDREKKTVCRYTTISLCELKDEGLDKIFITIPNQFETIKEEIKQYTTSECINIKDILTL